MLLTCLFFNDIIRICEIRRCEDEMIISERIFKVLSEKEMSQKEFSDRTGIACSTISDWKRKKTNPSADKIIDICSVLDVTPEQLLTGKGIDYVVENEALSDGLTLIERQLVSDYKGMKYEQQKRLLEYIKALKKVEMLEEGE